MDDSGILFVDDDSDLLRLATAVFECRGMAIHCAASGEEALRKIGERSFCLMVTDLNMPGLDGFELARKAREIAPDMAIVMGTGDTSPEIPRLAAEAGIARVFSKPFHLAKVLAMVKS
jgi:two-component system cell cycle response regulator CpdR